MANTFKIGYLPLSKVNWTNDTLEAARENAIAFLKTLPGVEVIGVRTTGLWGSIWSRAGRTSSPPFVPTLVRSVLLWFFVAPFTRRRNVAMHLENITERVKGWAGTLSRLEFNRKLEEWYNAK